MSVEGEFQIAGRSWAKLRSSSLFGAGAWGRQAVIHEIRVVDSIEIHQNRAYHAAEFDQKPRESEWLTIRSTTEKVTDKLKRAPGPAKLVRARLL
jgi:hypothetical protein